MAPGDWKRLDLGLLIPLSALLTERSVTKAADRLSIGQSSMSEILAKLRRHFDDQLLVRDGRTFQRTPLAESLLEPLEDLLVSAREVLNWGQSFDPATARRSFTVMASDYAATTLLLPALRTLTADAPRVQVRVEDLRTDIVDPLRNGQIDLLLWPLQLKIPDLAKFPRAPLFTDEFVTVADRDNHAVTGPLTAAELVRRPTVKINPIVAQLQPLPDFWLEEQVLPARAALTVGSFTLALHAVSGSELITTTQRRLFERLGPTLGLREIPMAMEAPKLTLAMFWHPRNTTAPAHRWLRERLTQTAGQLR
ncbi:LysR substrate-binding domain-containing protein [Kribbella sp. NPDC055071]